MAKCADAGKIEDIIKIEALGVQNGKVRVLVADEKAKRFVKEIADKEGLHARERAEFPYAKLI